MVPFYHKSKATPAILLPLFMPPDISGLPEDIVKDLIANNENSIQA
tara:strand:- start:252 stop:389 length:138 start_codon:yes stop_codon:yes gene_type:complete